MGVSIQVAGISKVNQYKYLRVWINAAKTYLSTREDLLKIKGKRNAAITKHWALWGHNKYQVVRGFWKAVMLPGLTFSDAVFCLKPEIQSGLEINHRAVGRFSLGAHGKTKGEAVQGDMGWTFFEVSEAQSKIGYELRLRNINDRKWASRVFKYVYLKSVDTQRRRRTRKLTANYMETPTEGRSSPDRIAR